MDDVMKQFQPEGIGALVDKAEQSLPDKPEPGKSRALAMALIAQKELQKKTPMAEAARRAGYSSASAMVRALEFFKIDYHTPPTRRGTTRRSEELDRLIPQAIEMLSRDPGITVAQAAAQFGLNPNNLRKQARARGIEWPDRKYAAKHRYSAVKAPERPTEAADAQVEQEHAETPERPREAETDPFPQAPALTDRDRRLVRVFRIIARALDDLAEVMEA